MAGGTAKYNKPNRAAPAGNVGTKGTREKVVKRAPVSSADDRTNTKSSDNTPNLAEPMQRRSGKIIKP